MSTSGLETIVTALAATLMLSAAARAQLVVCPGGPCTGVEPRRPGTSQYVSQPDMAAQFSPCFSSADAAFVGGSIRDSLIGAMRELDTNQDDPPPNPEIRHACLNGKSTFGGWLQPVGSYGTTDTATARNVGLGRVGLLVNGETVAFNFRPAGIARLVGIRWRDQPRQLNDDGDADPDGPVHLRGFNVFFQNEDALGRRIVDLAISGTYDYIQDTDFILHVYDFLTLSQYGQIQCETGAWADPTETTIDTVLGSLTGGAGGPMDDIVGKGPGCEIADRMPRTVLIPNSAAKVVFTYTRINAYQSSGGLFFGGTWEVKLRTPHVTVQGPTSILAEPNDPFAASYTALPGDLRAPYTVSFTSLNATPVSGTSRTARMIWSLPGLAVGQQAQRTLGVTITDADGNTATGYKPVVLNRVTDADPISATCKAKPWLPQCQ